MGKIEPVQRNEEVQQAWELSLEGKSKSEIARRLGRDRETITRYLEDAAAMVGGEDMEMVRKQVVSAYWKLYENAYQNLTDERIKPSTQTGPQWNFQARENLKQIARSMGVDVERHEHKHDVTLLHLLQASDFGAKLGDPTDFAGKTDEEIDEILEAEIIED